MRMNIKTTALAVTLLAILCGCPLQDHLTSRLYVIDAAVAQFEATDEPGVYLLKTQAVDPSYTWFTDRPVRSAGTHSDDVFGEQIWGQFFEGQQPSAGVAFRSSDGVWSTMPGQVLNAAFDLGNDAITWTLRLQGTPDMQPLAGAVVYLDDKGAQEADDDTHVFLHAAARAEFTCTSACNQFKLTLAFPLPELIDMTVSPTFHAALVRNDVFVEHMWPAGFADDPPNASVAIEGPDGALVITPVVLTDPQYDAAADTLTFTAQALDTRPPDFAGPATVFIDSWDDREDNTIYAVVVNHEEQYSIWPADRELPLGWNDTGFHGFKADCLAYIEEVWTDMRPLSLRKKMQEAGLGK